MSEPHQEPDDDEVVECCLYCGHPLVTELFVPYCSQDCVNSARAESEGDA